jgi:hypothetical protein
VDGRVSAIGGVAFVARAVKPVSRFSFLVTRPQRFVNEKRETSFVLQQLDHRRGGDNPRGFVPFQGKEFLVACHQELGLSSFGESKQIIVVWIGRNVELRKLVHDDGHIA